MRRQSEKQKLEFQLQVATRTINKLLNDIRCLEEAILHREDERKDFLETIKDLNDGLASCEMERRGLFREMYGEDDTEEEKIKYMADNYIELTINS